MSGVPPGCMTVPLRIGLDLVALIHKRRVGLSAWSPAGSLDSGHVPACLRVGAALATCLLVAASTLASPASAAPANIAGMIVFLDPGHNGSNDASISRQVPTGRGGTKDCQTSGT